MLPRGSLALPDLLQFLFAGLTNGAIYALIAKPFGFSQRTLWQIEPAHRADVAVEFKPI